MHFVDEDGANLLELAGDMTPELPGFAALSGDPSAFPLRLELTHRTFPKAGRYAFDLLINDGYVGRVPLVVNHRQKVRKEESE